jgi:hypothetical protein
MSKSGTKVNTGVGEGQVNTSTEGAGGKGH